MSEGAAGAALERVLRETRGRLLAALITRLRDFELAEECLQTTCEKALVHRARSGAPHDPAGWLLRAAERVAIDRWRRAARFRDRAEEIAVLAQGEAEAGAGHDLSDERLRLIFTCCHPALEQKTRVALTLHTLGGRAFLDKPATQGQRLSRAKRKIRDGLPVGEARSGDARDFVEAGRGGRAVAERRPPPGTMAAGGRADEGGLARAKKKPGTRPGLSPTGR